MCAAKKLHPYFQAHCIVVVTIDPLRKLFYSLTAARRLIPWAIELSEFDVNYVHRKAIKAQVVAEVLPDFAEGEIVKPEPALWGEVFNVTLEE